MLAPEVARRLYEAFKRKDGDAMAALYDENATFWDPAFGDLAGGEVGGMWRMLTSRSSDLEISFVLQEEDDAQAVVRWTARYTFSATGRKVENRVVSRLRVRDGRVVAQRDEFDFYGWARQALGPIGLAIGWSGFFQRAFQRKARAALRAYLAGERAPAPVVDQQGGWPGRQ